MFKDDVHASPVGNTPYFLGDFLFVVINRVVGAQLARLSQLPVVPGCGDDRRAKHLTYLDRRRPHA